MLAILWFHTEMYYVGNDVTPYALYVGDVLAVFFFISGYLFYQDHPICVRNKLYAIFRRLVIPYFVFTALLALPKAYAHQSFEGFGSIVINILSGNASWFISALIVAELLFVAALYFFQGRKLLLLALAILMLAFSAWVGNAHSPWHYEQNLWHLNEATLGFFLMTVGYFFHCYEGAINRYLHNRIGLTFLVVLCVVSKYIILRTNAQLVFGPIIVSNNLLFVADLLLVILLLVELFRRLPKNAFIEWVGRHSIVYYFLAGAVPFAVASGLHRCGFNDSGYLSIACAFGLVCLLSTVLVWAVYRYTRIVQ